MRYRLGRNLNSQPVFASKHNIRLRAPPAHAGMRTLSKESGTEHWLQRRAEPSGADRAGQRTGSHRATSSQRTGTAPAGRPIKHFRVFPPHGGGLMKVRGKHILTCICQENPKHSRRTSNATNPTVKHISKPRCLPASDIRTRPDTHCTIDCNRLEPWPADCCSSLRILGT